MLINEYISIEEFDSKNYQIRVVEKIEEEKAILTHYLNNLKSENITLYKTKAKQVLKNYISFKNNEKINIVEEEALQRLLFEVENVPFPSPKNYKFEFIDLFAGVGGFRIALQNVGGKCVYTSEWNDGAKKTYRENFGEIPFGDITKDSVKHYIPENFDVLCAGFPCQAFSIAGYQKGFSDTRGTLFFEIERILKEKKPKAFLLENVKQLRGHDKGRTLKVILQHLDALNYYVKFEVLRAGDFGVPQNRERIYIVGLDKDYYDIPSDYDFAFPEPAFIKTRLGDILEENVDEKYTISDSLWEGHQRRKKEHKEKGNGFGYSLFNSESEYANTISARYYKDGSEILIEQENRNPRKLTPRECARLQGFPEQFIIPVSDTQAYKQFGNSVAVPVVRAVAGQIYKAMNELPVRNAVEKK